MARKEKERVSQDADLCTRCPPASKGSVRHFKMVGGERIEIPPEKGATSETCDCEACQMDEVIAVFGTDNLE